MSRKGQAVQTLPLKANARTWMVSPARLWSVPARTNSLVTSPAGQPQVMASVSIANAPLLKKSPLLRRGTLASSSTPALAKRFRLSPLP
jgi:hypothetical protein